MGVKFGAEEEGTKVPLDLVPRPRPKVPSSVPNFTPLVQLKFLLRFNQNVEYKRPAGAFPFAIFIQFAEFVPNFRMR